MTPPDSAGALSHPLFDPASYYRLATQESLWEDGGVESVVRFFHGLARQALHEEWQQGPPPQPQDWGLGDPANRAVHDFLLHNDRVAREERERLDVFRTKAVAAAPPLEVRAREDLTPALTPALAVLRLRSDQPSQPVVHRAPADLFTGVGTPPGKWQDTFALVLSGLPAQCCCMVLILVCHLIDRLASALGFEKPPVRDVEIINVLTDAFSPQTLSRQNEKENLLRRASRVSGLLALAPGLEGRTDDAGRFEQHIALHRPCPTLPLSTWVVACVDAG